MRSRILIAIILLMTTSISAERLVVLEDLFTNPYLSLDDNHLYIYDINTFVESFGIYIYSRADFSKIAKIGKIGEGPGEFKFGPSLTILPNSLCLITIGKEVIYSKTGEFLRERKISARVREVSPIGNHYFSVASTYDKKTFEKQTEFKLWDKKFNFIKTLLNYSPKMWQIAGKVKGDYWFLETIPRYAIYNSSVIIGDPREDFIFYIIDPSENTTKRIVGEYQKRKVTSKHKEEILNNLRNSIKTDWEKFKLTKRFNFPKYFPPYKGFKVADDKIYAYEDPIYTDRCKLHILDLNGKILKQTSMVTNFKGNFSNGKYYYLVDNLNTQKWELHVDEFE